MDRGKLNAGIAGPAEGGRGYPYPAGRKSFYNHHLSIIHHHVIASTTRQSRSIINRQGFTLIELLVVIAIIALLMAILMPSLQRVRNQARAVACRAQLGQWGILHATYAAENNGLLPPYFEYGDRAKVENPADPWWALWRWQGYSLNATDAVKPDKPESPSFTATRRILRCPMAAKRAYPDFGPSRFGGGTFLAWSYIPLGRPGAWFLGESSPWFWSGSYGASEMARSAESRPIHADPRVEASWATFWQTTMVKNASSVPVVLDSMVPRIRSLGDEKVPPPDCDAIPTRTGVPGVDIETPCAVTCMNRHDGGINSLFLDWSVRKAGLKELWTLKWWPSYNTQGPWTKAGGAKPENWPQWLRGCRDY